MTDFERANRFNDEGNRLRDAGDILGAEAAYRAAASAAPEWSVPVYNLGLIYKYDGRGQESLACNQQAAGLEPDDEASGSLIFRAQKSPRGMKPRWLTNFATDAGCGRHVARLHCRAFHSKRNSK